MKLTAEQKAWIVKYISQQRDRAEDATRTFRQQWRELWQAYQSKQDYSAKADWQAKAFVPKVWMKIERAAGEIKRALLQTKRLFKFELDDDQEKGRIAELRTGLLNEQSDANRMAAIQAEIQTVERRLSSREEIKTIQEKRFKNALDDTNLVAVYSEMVKAGFLLGIGIPKVGWDSHNHRATYKHVNALNFRIDPDWEPSSDSPAKYVIEDYEQTLSELKEEAWRANKALKAANPNAVELYDMTTINKIETGSADLEKQQRETEQKGLDHIEPRDRIVQLWQYWGDIPQENGKGYLLRNVMVIVANEAECVRISKNPFQHGKAPYVITMPIVYPHRGCAGNSLAQPVVRMNYVYNNLWNMLIDNLNFSVNKQFQGNPNHLLNAKDQAIYPGKFWATNLGPGQTAIAEVPSTAVHSDILMAMEVIRQDIEEGMSVTRTLEGAATTRKEPLGTTQLKTAQAQSFFDIIAWDLERNSLTALLEMTYDLYEQYANYPSRRGNFRLRVGGITLMIQIKQMIDRIITILAVAAKDPRLNQLTDVKWLYQRLLDLQNLSDAFIEPQAGQVPLSPQQTDAISRQAESDARRDVDAMRARGQLSNTIPIAGAQ